jgi:hypothetical protein
VLGWVYPACGLLTLVTIAVALAARQAAPRREPEDEPISAAV